MDNEMIERVIKASFDCWAEDKGKSHFTVNDLSSDEYQFAVKHAVAIVKAMREPTDKMLEAGAKLGPDRSCEEYYQAMIDAVIND